jgi:PAS domain-containing protein
MVSKEVSVLQEKVSLYEAVLNNILSGVIITDPDGSVIFFSETYAGFWE